MRESLVVHAEDPPGADQVLVAEDPPSSDQVLVVGDLRVWPDEFVAELAGERLSLTSKEFLLLTLFMRNPGRLLRRERIAAEVVAGPDEGPGHRGERALKTR